MILKRIKYEKYDELFSKINPTNFFKDDSLKTSLEAYSEDIRINNNLVDINIDIGKYNKIIEESTSKGESSILLAIELYKDFVYKENGIEKKLPQYLMYEKEFWTYLNLTVFFEIIKRKYINDPEKVNYSELRGKIERLYFNSGGTSRIDRTGLRYLWVLADLTVYNNDFELTRIAWEFIDPFKAIQECVLGTNPIILKAFTLAIKKMNYNPLIRSKDNRKIIPRHIRNYACSIFLDGFDSVEKLSDELIQQINKIIKR